MELRHLRYFVAVAEALSFSLAAQRLFITQPALSRQIRDLEEQMGFRLFRRSSARVTLTAAGQAFLLRAREVLAAADHAVDAARAAAQAADSVLRLGHYGTLWVDRYAPALRKFARQQTDVRLEPVDATPVELGDDLRRGTIDLALIGLADAALNGEFATRRIETLPLMLALGAGNPLAKRRRYALAELRDASWIVWDERAFPGRKGLLLDAAARAGFTPRIGGVADGVSSLFLQVSTSDAIGYVLPMSRKLPHDGVAFVALDPPAIEMEMHVTWRREAERIDRLESLAELLATTPPAT